MVSWFDAEYSIQSITMCLSNKYCVYNCHQLPGKYFSPIDRLSIMILRHNIVHVLYVYRLLYDVLTMSCYIGALLAIQRGYDVIVSYLLELTIRRLQADKSSHIPLSVSDVITEYRTWKDCLCNNRYTTHMPNINTDVT